MITRVAGWLSVTVTLAAVPRLAAADAWSGEKGELGVTFGQAFQFSDAIYYGEFGRITGLPAQSLRSTLGVELTPVAKLTIGADLTGQFDRYTGPATGANPDIIVAHGENDDGDWHGSVTDANLEVRYQVYDGAVAISPALKTKIPVTDYETIGYTSAGTGLMEFGAGIAIGKMGLGTENLFLEASYTFMFVQKEDAGGEVTEDFSTHYSLANLTLGYFFGEKFNAMLGGEFRLTHGGVELDEIRMISDPEEQATINTFHDSILARRYFAPTLGANYSLNDSLTLSANAAIVVWGDNVSDAKVFGLSLSWATLVL